ncbi:MAG TPA: thiamine diphosphokinase, partial [Acidimicrobiia bacterium]|nr:thiamine diphosphokinase [Acidimicrobiia bacterium]
MAIVFAGSQPVSPTVLDRLPDRGDVIAADSGLGVAMALGVHVDHLVGDLDSAAPHAVDAAVASGTTVERHPAEKDATDLELAFDA